MSEAENTRVKRLIRKAENHEVLSLVIITFLVVMAILGMVNLSLEVAERAGWTEASPRAPSLPLPVGYIDAAKLTAPSDEIELFCGCVASILQNVDGKPTVQFTYRGMDTIEPQDDQYVLVAQIEVTVNGRRMGTAFRDYVDVKSVLDRSRVQSPNTPELRFVEGDVLTIAGSHQFMVERVWHDEPRLRPAGDPQTSVVLVPLR
jgi:hypothetical protein